MLKGQCSQLLALSREELVGCDDQRACSQFGKLRKNCVKIAAAARLQYMQL